MQYLIESAICLAVLYAFYRAFLHRETFFQFNRWYLLLAPLLAFGIPALNIRLEHVAAAEGVASTTVLPVAPVIPLPTAVERLQVAPRYLGTVLDQPLWSLRLGEMLWWIYLAVAGVLLLRLAVQVYRMIRFLRICRKETQTGVILATGPAGTPLASFFGFVFWHPGEAEGKEQEMLLEHEMVHVRQWHSLDLIFMELLIALQWFNPLLYLYRRSLRTVHEYIADDYVVRRTRQPYAYARLLVSRYKTGNGAQPGLVNTFHSFIQNRLLMLTKHPSRPLQKTKYLLALPIFGALMLLFSFRLVDVLPETELLREATEKLDHYAGQLSEVVLIQAETPADNNPTYSLYWGALQVPLEQQSGDKRWYGESSISPELFREIIKREPRLWNGAGLEARLTFRVGTIQVRSDYNDETLYENIRPSLDSLAWSLSTNDVLELELQLPDAQQGRIRLLLNGVTPDWVIRSKAGETSFLTDPNKSVLTDDAIRISWGDQDPLRYEFITTEQLEVFLNTTPVAIYGDERKEAITDRLALFVYGSDRRMLSLVPAEPEGLLTLEEVQSKLRSLLPSLQPGAVVSVFWNKGKLEEGNTSPVTTHLLALEIAAPVDPRLMLQRDERMDYRLEWGNLVVGLPSRYAKSYISGSPGAERLHADRSYEHQNFQFTRREIIRMLRLQPRLLQEGNLLDDFNFTLDYKGYGVVVRDGDVPEEMIHKLEQSLQPGDVLLITGLQAWKNDTREVVITKRQMEQIQQKIQIDDISLVEIRRIGSDRMFRVTLPASAVKKLKKELGETVPEMWYQYGDIDLSTMRIALEVRSDDPKPPLTRDRQ